MPAEHRRPSEAQRAGAASRRFDRDATLDAMHRLEAALAVAAPGREMAWRDDVLTALGELDTVMSTEAANAAEPDSLLSDLRRSQPRLRSQARGVQLQYRQVTDAIAALRDELTVDRADHRGTGDGDTPDVGDIRHRLAWLLMALRHQRARESDLIHEAYYDAFGVTLDDS